VARGHLRGRRCLRRRIPPLRGYPPPARLNSKKPGARTGNIFPLRRLKRWRGITTTNGPTPLERRDWLRCWSVGYCRCQPRIDRLTGCEAENREEDCLISPSRGVTPLLGADRGDLTRVFGNLLTPGERLVTCSSSHGTTFTPLSGCFRSGRAGPRSSPDIPYVRLMFGSNRRAQGRDRGLFGMEGANKPGVRSIPNANCLRRGDWEDPECRPNIGQLLSSSGLGSARFLAGTTVVGARRMEQSPI
jgi:hypothetical protein